MKIVVIGGTGLIGSKLVAQLGDRGHEAVAAAPNTGVNTITGEGHHVALSVVGTQRLSESGYFRGKIAQEALITASPIPYSIVHATQFFEFVKSIAAAATEGDSVHLAPVRIQPMASDDVASGLCRVVLGEPVLGTVEIAGPEEFRLDDRTLLPGIEARIGTIRFEDWLAQPAPATPPAAATTIG